MLSLTGHKSNRDAIGAKVKADHGFRPRAL